MSEEAEFLLVLVRAFFARFPERFCRSGAARDAAGALCDPIASDAHAFSVTGALDRALFETALVGNHRINVAPAPGALGRAYVVEACGVLVPRLESWALLQAVEGVAARLGGAGLADWLDDAIRRGRAARSIAATKGDRAVVVEWTLVDVAVHVECARRRARGDVVTADAMAAIRADAEAAMRAERDAGALESVSA